MTNVPSRCQPWSTYAVHQTTLFQWGLFWDFAMIYAYLLCSHNWEEDIRLAGFAALMTWMFISKFVKLLGHYIRYPVDFLLLPISISFGYLHGLIKARAMFTLNVVGSILLPLASACTVLLMINADSLGDQRWCGRRRRLQDDSCRSQGPRSWHMGSTQHGNALHTY